jgi:hypothetical protein
VSRKTGTALGAWRFDRRCLLLGVLGITSGFLLAAMVTPRCVSAQSKVRWDVPTTLGFGGLGCAAGHLVAHEATRDSAGRRPVDLISTGLGCFLGGAAGHRLGLEVDAFLARGERVPTEMRRGVQLGTVLTGATLATLISFLHITFEEGRDAEIITTYALTGGALGALAQLALNRHLHPQKASPSLQLQGSPAGGVSLSVRYRF